MKEQNALVACSKRAKQHSTTSNANKFYEKSTIIFQNQIIIFLLSPSPAAAVPTAEDVHHNLNIFSPIITWTKNIWIVNSISAELVYKTTNFYVYILLFMVWWQSRYHRRVCFSLKEDETNTTATTTEKHSTHQLSSPYNTMPSTNGFRIRRFCIDHLIR